MQKYEFFEHTADAKFRAYGNTFEEQLENAALAMFSVMTDVNKINPKIKKTIEISGKDKQTILYNFLEELLFLLDTDNFVPASLKEIKIYDGKVKAIFLGDRAENYSFHGEVKAVTFNEMEITDNYVQVVIDL